MQAHELLEINIKQLKEIDDKVIREAYAKKLENIKKEEEQKIKQQELGLSNMSVADIESINRQRKEAKDAFHQLETKIQRHAYVAKQEREKTFGIKQENEKVASVVTAVKNDKQMIMSGSDLSAIKKAYDKFTEENYRNHANKLQFKSRDNNYPTFKEFKKSDFYKSLNEKQRKQYSKEKYPKKTTTLSFDNADDAAKFVQRLEDKGLVNKGETQKYKNDLTKKGYTFKEKQEDKKEDKREEKKETKKEEKKKEEKKEEKKESEDSQKKSISSTPTLKPKGF